MPEPEIKTVWQDQRCKFDVPADSCRIRHGYKDRDQIVFEWRGDHFYLSSRQDGRFPDRAIAAAVSLEVLAEHWPQIVEFFQSKAAEAVDKKEANNG